MRCISCQHDNRDGAKFCEECAAPLKRLCASCGAELRQTAKFCDACGAQLQGVKGLGDSASTLAPNPVTPNPLAVSRKVISIVFADLMGSTALQEGLDPESVNRVMDAYYQAVRGPVEAAGGTVVQLLGDGVFCAFGIPQIAEDDALRAVRAAVGVQQAFREFLQRQQWLNVPIGLRVAVNTGEVVVSEEHPAGIGDPLNVAARLQQEARDGEVLIGQATRRLVAEQVTLERAGVFALKGRAETVTAYRVVSLERPTGTTTAFVGRDEELARLTAVYEAAVAAPAAKLGVLLGSPGLGKSRLIEEISQRLGGQAGVIAARCDAAGGATFAPIADALREFLGRDGSHATDGSHPFLDTTLSGEADCGRITAGISALFAGSPASPEETFFVIRRFLASLARQRPVVLVIDDLQWAEPLLLDLVEHLVQWGSGVPLLVLVGARPELRDRRSSLANVGGVVSDVVTLSGLDAGAAMRLAANVIGAADLPATVAAKVLATSEGNPLFVGELVRMLVDEGAIERQGDRWTVGANLAGLEMPPTIHALLAARIERLQPEERTVLERAAIVGRHFSRSAVAALLGNEGVDLNARLETLRRTELIEPDSGWFLGEPVLRFHHVLIRDAAYRRLLKGTRAEMHERLAAWIESKVGDAAEHDETVGWHLEQAHELLGELGPIDADGKALGERAAQRLSAAGRRALARDDVPVAADLLGRAVERLDPDDPARAELALDWCEALLSAGDVGAATKAIEELGRFVGGSLPFSKPVLSPVEGGGQEGFVSRPSEEIPLSPPLPKGEESVPNSQPLTPNPLRLRAWHTCFAGQLSVMTAPQELQATADDVAGAADEFAKLGDAAGEAKAHSVHAQALARLGRVGACEAALDKALAAARKAGDRRRANAVLAGAPVAALWGPSPVTRASGRCLDVVRVLRITQGAPAVEAVALSCQGVLEALRGRTDAARRMIASSRKMVEELGIAHRLFEADVFAGRIDLLEGDAATAEHTLRSAYDGLRDLGLGIDAARAGALLARALLVQDKVDEAESLTRESEQLAGDDLQAAIAWRGVRAEALARRGDHDAAIELAQAAVAIAAATDALLDHADARLALAAALRAVGRAKEADAEESRAIELWEAKGATLLAARTHPWAAQTVPVASAPGQRIEPAPGLARRVSPNAVTTSIHERVDAALAARDLDAVSALLAEDFEEIHHPTGARYGRAGVLASLERLFRSENATYQTWILANLGESLSLVRRRFGASATGGGRFDVGKYESEEIGLVEVNEQGLASRRESFAPNRLSAAVTRLYERYAEILPAGADQARAAATARSVRAMLSMADLDHFATALAPDIRSIDHRNVGFGVLEGAEAALASLRALMELSDDIRWRLEDVLGLLPNALVIRSTNTGTERASGGSFQRDTIALMLFGPDGLITHWEQFDVAQRAEALAHFDDLVSSGGDAVLPRATPTTQAVQRRVPSNAATAMQERFSAALDARDLDGVRAIFSEKFQVVDHPTGSLYGADESMASLQRLLRSRDPSYQLERLATLGPSLLLVRRRTGASGATSTRYDVGEYENEAIQLFEVDERQLLVRSEVFAADHLGDAIARLYERYAEQLPQGPARDRAAMTARAATAMLTGSTKHRLEDVMVPDIQAFDHRAVVGIGSMKGPLLLARWLAASEELMQESTVRIDDVLVLSPDGLLRRTTHAGKVRASGGVFETKSCSLSIFGPDGRQARIEIFDVDHEAEALARFDVLVGSIEDAGRDRPKSARVEYKRGGPRTDLPPPKSRLGGEGEAALPIDAEFENAATRLNERFVAACQERDWKRLADMHAPSHHYDDRRQLMQIRTPVDMSMAGFQVLFEADNSRFVVTPIATRGERLSLTQAIFEGDAPGGGGPLAIDYLVVDELDDSGRFAESVLFDPDDLDAAYAELDARWEAGEGAEHPATLALAQALGRAAAARDWKAQLALCAPDFVFYDHRLLGWGQTMQDANAWIRVRQALVELAPDVRICAQHHRFSARGWLQQVTQVGTREGGNFATQWTTVIELDDQGRIRRLDAYDLDRLDEARVRFAELDARWEHTGRGSRPSSGEVPPFANAAWQAAERILARWRARDWEGFKQMLPAHFRYLDRRKNAHLELGGDQFVDYGRLLGDMKSARIGSQALATRGETLALGRTFIEVAEGDVGPSELRNLDLIEIDEQGSPIALVRFDPEDLDAAYAELDARWEAGEGTKHPKVVPLMQRHRDALRARDWEAVTACYAPDFVGRDHRLVGWGTLRGPSAFLPTLREMIELAPDAHMRMDHLRVSGRGQITEAVWVGTREGGAFESPFLAVAEVDAAGRLVRFDFYDPHYFEAAVARFEEIAAQPENRPKRLDRGVAEAVSRPPSAPETPTAQLLATIARSNAAHAAMQRWKSLFERVAQSGDWDPVRAICSASLVFEDRRRLFLLSGGIDLMIASAGERMAIGARPRLELLGAAGDRISIERVLWSGGPSDGPFEIEYLGLWETDESGLITTMMLFDADEAPAVQREAWKRWAAIDPSVAEVTSVLGEVIDCWNAKDLERLRALFVEDLVAEDHRRTGTGRSEGREAYLQSVAALWQLAPESTFEAGWLWLAAAPQAGAYTARRSGMLPGGGEFESDFLIVVTVANGRTTRVEIFEIDDVDAAIVRFDELTAGLNSLAGKEEASPSASLPVSGRDRGRGLRVPVKDTRLDLLRIPTNAASGVLQLITSYFDAADWDAASALCEEMVFEDRRRLFLTTGDGEQFLANSRFIWESGMRPSYTLLATAGDRLLLQRGLWRSLSEGETAEVETLEVFEVDDVGRVIALILFEPDDRVAASTELFERYVATGADGAPAEVLDIARAWNDHDLVRLRSLLPDDFYLDDRRRTGVGRVAGADAYVDSIAALYGLSHDIRSEILYTVATAKHGHVSVTRWSGTNEEGGEFEAVYVIVGLLRNGRPAGMEIFELEDLDAALARFEELRDAEKA